MRERVYTLGEIAEIVGGKLHGNASDQIDHLFTDTRKTILNNALFVAIVTDKNNGHSYIKNAFDKGAKAALVSQKPNKEVSYILVSDTLEALQSLARHHRNQFDLPVIGVTGSNGKTIVKEWISTLLSDRFNVCKNPKSYNSQIGVPLSLWRLKDKHSIGIFEAGISKPKEMSRLAKMIQPDIGVFTYLGDAHAVNFQSQEQKLDEKLTLFESCETIICPENQQSAISKLQLLGKNVFTWGSGVTSDLHVSRDTTGVFLLTYLGVTEKAELNLIDKASLENTFTAIATSLVLGENLNSLCSKVSRLSAIDMRLQEVKGQQNNQLIVDYYNSDFQSVNIALDFLVQQKNKHVSTVIVSDILESDLTEQELYKKLAATIERHDMDQVIGIGPRIMYNQDLFATKSIFYESTSSFLQKHPIHELCDQSILVKGARDFAFEKIVERLKLKTHQTSLEVNLSRLQTNLDTIRAKLDQKVKIMAMVKALAYGSGGYQIARLLEKNGVDYLGVAYTDEAVQLRADGITLPIMVLNPDLTDLTPYLETDIQPVIYSFSSLKNLGDNKVKIHIEFDTGMHRLGFTQEDISRLKEYLKHHQELELVSVFSHLAGSDERSLDSFTEKQLKEFNSIYSQMELKEGVLKHIANTGGIERHPKARLDMVRLGIGLYGISSLGSKSELLPVGSFKSYISQIRKVPPGEGIGYGQHDKSDKERDIAVVAVGYADGYSRAFSRGEGYFLVGGRKAKVVGNVCMDMTMCDVSGIDCREGDEVIIFGDKPRVEELAENIGTIPYEILTNVSDRVNRVYFQE